MRKKAFTLVELLVVIGIIAVLIGILLPVLGVARRQANTVKCGASMREIGNALKLYELDSKGYWPPVRLLYYSSRTDYPATGASTAPYNIDGISYPVTVPGTTSPGQAYWYTFLSKYVTKTKVGNASLNAFDAATARASLFYACPAWAGYQQGGVYVGDVNQVQTGYGMNDCPAFLPESSANKYSPASNLAIISYVAGGANANGTWFKAKAWTHAAERQAIADSKFYLDDAYTPETLTAYPPAVASTGQPIIANSTTYAAAATAIQFNAPYTTADIYRHGKYPGRTSSGINFDPYGGKIGFNILYCDGHVALATDAREAYRSIRMKFPG